MTDIIIQATCPKCVGKAPSVNCICKGSGMIRLKTTKGKFLEFIYDAAVSVVEREKCLFRNMGNCAGCYIATCEDRDE